MKLIFTLVFASLFPVALMATEAVEATDLPVGEAGDMLESDAAPEEVTAEEAAELLEEADEGLLFLDAREVNVRDFIWEKRIVVVMADTPDDPQFNRQIEALRARDDEFVERDVVVIFDANPDDRSPLRQVLRPRGFVTAIIDKDGEVKARRPAVRSGRELMAVIDRFPTRRQELLDRLPSGR